MKPGTYNRVINKLTGEVFLIPAFPRKKTQPLDRKAGHRHVKAKKKIA